MESIRNLAKQAQNERETILPFRKLPSMSDQVTKLMQSTSDCFPHSELLDSTAREWFLIWMQMATDYGFSSLESAVNRLKTKLLFFPKPAEIRREIDEMLQEERAAAEKNEAKFVSCGKCFSSGHIHVNCKGKPLNITQNEDRFLEECECLKSWKAKRKSICRDR